MTLRRHKVRQYHGAGCTEEEVSARRKAAFAAIRSLYAESLPLWRVCRRGACRRHRCCGDAKAACLPQGWDLLPDAVQERAKAQVRRGGPRRLKPATKSEFVLRHYPPSNFVRR